MDNMSDKSNFLLQQFIDSLLDIVFVSAIKKYKKCILIN